MGGAAGLGHVVESVESEAKVGEMASRRSNLQDGTRSSGGTTGAAASYIGGDPHSLESLVIELSSWNVILVRDKYHASWWILAIGDEFMVCRDTAKLCLGGSLTALPYVGVM